MKSSAYNILVVLAACLGSFTYGYLTSVLAPALAKVEFFEYLGLDSTSSRATSMISVWMCVLYVGAFFGAIAYSWVSYNYGRRVPILCGCFFALLGSALQAGCINIAMLSVARLITGVGSGFLLPAIPLYQAEVAPAHSRGLMVGLHGSALGFGNMFAAWMSCAFFDVYGQASWRAPFGITCVFPGALFILVIFLPESPRWLYAQGRSKDAEGTFLKLHRTAEDPDGDFARHEYLIVKAQLDIDLQKKTTVWKALRVPSQRRRFILGFLTMMGTQCSGLNVILSYSPIIYGGLGFSPFMTNVMAGIWLIFNGLGNIGGALIADRVGRRKQMIAGYIGVAISLTGATVLSRFYAGTQSDGSKAAVFFIFAIIVTYTLGIEAASFVFVSEIFPSELRAQGVAFSMQGLFLSTILWTTVASPALSHIKWRFYIVFICTTLMMIVIIYFLFPETKGYSLEQLAAVFGDEVVDDQGHLHGEYEMKKGVVLETEEVGGSLDTEIQPRIEK